MSRRATRTSSSGDVTSRRTRGEKPSATVDELRAGFADPEMIYGPFMFWFWDAPLDDSEPRAMARTMLTQNINPGYVHARRSMVDGPELDPRDEWLSSDWFDAFECALEEAESKNAHLGYCDEYWWPSMQAGGRVVDEHPELESEYLRWWTGDVPGGETVSVPDGSFGVVARLDDPLSDDGPTITAVHERHVPRTIRSETLSLIDTDGEWTAPIDGDWRVYAFSTAVHDGTPNYIDENLASAFIDIALEPYDARFGDRLGDSIPGDFIDNEGSYGDHLAWSDSLERRYEQVHGRDARQRMPLLLDEDAEGTYASARVAWFEVVAELYAGNYAAVTEWHERRGMYTTGHFWEESLASQVRWVGDHFAMQRALTMPGQDCLGDSAMSAGDFKEAQSVAEFESSRFMTEFMGAGGHTKYDQYNKTGEFSGGEWETFLPDTIKRFSNAIFAWGASHVIPHGAFMTRTLDGNPWPPDWHDVNPMFPYLHNWADFVRRACYVNSHGDQAADVLLVNPMETVWALSGYELFDETLAPDSPEAMWRYPEQRATGERINGIDEVYFDAMDVLANERIEFLIADRHYLGQMTAAAGRLHRGDATFGAVVLPPLEVLSLDAAATLVAFAESGGPVYALGSLPSGSTENGMADPRMVTLMERLDAQPSVTFVKDVASVIGSPGVERHVEFVDGSFDLLQHHRRIDDCEFVWLANDTDDEQTCELFVRDASGAAERWHPETGAIETVGSDEGTDGSRVSLSFDPYESFWLVFDPERMSVDPADVPTPTVDVLTSVEGPWTVSYDADAQPPVEYPVEPPESFHGDGRRREFGSWHDDWGVSRSFSGRLDYETSVVVPAVDTGLVLDLGVVRWAAEVWINGDRLGDSLWFPHRIDVTRAIRPGENTIRVRVANLVNNNYDDVRDSGLFGPVRLLSLSR